MQDIAKTAEPIKMPFWRQTHVSPRNHVLEGGCICVPNLVTNCGDVYQKLKGLLILWHGAVHL